MTLRTPATITPSLAAPISFKALDLKKLIDSQNVTNNRGTQETRYGLERYLAEALGGPIQSLSYFKKTNDEYYLIAKVGGNLFKIAQDKTVTLLKSGLSESDKHRAITLNNRHIITIGNSGFFSTDMIKFTQIGQLPPVGIVSTVVAGGSLTASVEYQVAVTYYSSITGFESNAFYSASLPTTASNKQINLSSIPGTAANAFIDKIRIYIKNVTSNTVPALVATIDLGVSTYSITANSLSTITVPTKHSVPQATGARFIVEYGDQIVTGGSDLYPNELEFSEKYLPDAYDSTSTKKVVQVGGGGKVMGMAVGFYNENHLSPYLVALKTTSITIYSELDGSPTQVVVENKIGCVCSDSITIRNGIVTFMSSHGWYSVHNGQLIKNESHTPASLGDGDIDDIFTKVGWERELNTKRFSSFFSAYFTPNKEYMTFIAEAGSDKINKAYVYVESIGGFRCYKFPHNLTAAVTGESVDDDNVIFLADDKGMIYTYSAKNDRTDEDFDGTKKQIEAYHIPAYITPNDYASTYNYRLLTVRAITSDNPIQIQAMASFNGMTSDLINYDFPKNDVGFTLDVSKLDRDRLGEEQSYVTAYLDLCLTGEALKLGFYQTALNGNIGLVNMQLQMNKNGNNNT